MSQEDFFNGYESPSKHRKCVSLPTSSFIYRWVIIFNWNGENPFKVYEREMFKEIKDKWIQGLLKGNSRAKKLMVSALPAQTISLFAKVDQSK